jgi:1-deoxy-D-xylulose-5-phosphate synthase
MSSSVLRRIKSPEDLRGLSYPEIHSLSREIRRTIIEVVGTNGGHLASNLGVVELTIALHRVFESPRDAIIWDVGHQCYTHKILTGRFDRFHTIRKKDGLSGFPKKDESPHDLFDTGTRRRRFGGFRPLEARRSPAWGKVIAVIGDGALTGGMAFEALSHAGQGDNDLVVILNDNKMSIGPNTGALSEYLSRLTMGARVSAFPRARRPRRAHDPAGRRPTAWFISRCKRAVKGLLFKDNLFVDLGFEYVGPLNGHNVEELEKVLRDVRVLRRPVVVHVQTKKGKGYSLAENDPSAFHGVGPFCISDGTVEKFDTTSFTEAFSRAILDEAASNPDVVAITAAMAKGTGLAAFQHRHPDRFFDVGIAEQHAVTFAGGLAAGERGRSSPYTVPSCSARSTRLSTTSPFSGCPSSSRLIARVRFRRRETHQGLFDISLFRPVPGISLLAPASARELRAMLSGRLGTTGR